MLGVMVPLNQPKLMSRTDSAGLYVNSIRAHLDGKWHSQLISDSEINAGIQIKLGQECKVVQM